MLQHFINNSFENLNYQRLSVASVLLFLVLTLVLGVCALWCCGRSGPLMKSCALRLWGWLPPWLLLLSAAPLCMCWFSAFSRKGPAFSVEGYYRVFWAPRSTFSTSGEPVPLRRYRGGAGGPVGVRGLGFAKYAFPGKNFWFFLLLVVMVLPLQVTLVPNFRILGALGPAGYPVGLGAARHVRAPGHLPHDPMLPLGAR